MMDGVRLGQEIGEVVWTWSPYHDEVTHGYAVAKPVVAHSDCLGALELAGVVGDLASDGVVEDDRRWVGLRVAEVGSSLAEDFAGLGVDVRRGVFGLRGGLANGWYLLADGGYSALETLAAGRGRSCEGGVSHEEGAAGAGAGAGFRLM